MCMYTTNYSCTAVYDRDPICACFRGMTERLIRSDCQLLAAVSWLIIVREERSIYHTLTLQYAYILSTGMQQGNMISSYFLSCVLRTSYSSSMKYDTLFFAAAVTFFQLHFFFSVSSFCWSVVYCCNVNVGYIFVHCVLWSMQRTLLLYSYISADTYVYISYSSSLLL